MTLQATEIIVSTLAFEANLNGIEIARQGLLNLTRDINTAATKFTNMFETVANKMLGIAGPAGMVKNITIASIILPLEQATADLEIATASWTGRERKALEDFRGELTKTSRWLLAEVAKMQTMFAEAHLAIPTDMDQPAFINKMSESALRMAKILNTSKDAAQELLATQYKVEAARGPMTEARINTMVGTITHARTKGGWTEQEMGSLQRMRQDNPEGRRIPLESAVAIGQMGPSAGAGRAEAVGVLDSILTRLHKDAEAAGGITRSRVGADIMSAGVNPAELMGALGTGDMELALKLMGQIGDEAKDIGGNDPLLTDRQLVIMSELTKILDEYNTIVKEISSESGGLLEHLFGKAEDTKSLTTAISRAHTAMGNLFASMAKAGVLDAITALMNMIAKIAETFNSLPGPVKQVIALFIKIQIWFSVIVATLTVLIGLTISYIVYVWGMGKMLRWALIGIVHFSRSLIVMGNWLLAAAFRMHYWAIAARTGTLITTRFTWVNRVLNIVMKALSGTMLLASRVISWVGASLTFTGHATLWTAKVGLFLTKVYNGLMWVLGKYIAFLKVQLIWTGRITAAIWRYVAARFAANSVMGRALAISSAIIVKNLTTAASYMALWLASLFTAIGMHGISAAFVTMNVAGGPVLWIIGAIIIAMALLAVGIYFLIKHFSAIVGWVKSAIQWIGGLSHWFLILLGPIGLVIKALLLLKDLWDWFTGKKSDPDEDKDTDNLGKKPGSKKDKKKPSLPEYQWEDDTKEEKKGGGVMSKVGLFTGFSNPEMPDMDSMAENFPMQEKEEKKDKGFMSKIGSKVAQFSGFGSPEMPDMDSMMRDVPMTGGMGGLGGVGGRGGEGIGGRGEGGIGGPGGRGGEGIGGVGGHGGEGIGGAGGHGGIGGLGGAGGISGPGGVGGRGGMATGNIAMQYSARQDMNLPVGIYKAQKPVTSTTSYQFNMTFNLPEGADPHTIARIAREEVEDALDKQFRETQTDFSRLG